MKKYLIKYLVLGLILLLFCGKDQDKAKKSAVLKDFTLSSIDGENFTLSALKGRVVLIDFWATWCPPCRNSIPVISSLFQRYRDQDFIVLGISNEDLGILREFRDTAQIPYPILLGTNEVMNDYGVQAIPTMILINKNGDLVMKQVGFAPELEAQLDARVDSLLKE
jgi:thiol-disulfide isomerase/thioredoxin